MDATDDAVRLAKPRRDRARLVQRPRPYGRRHGRPRQSADLGVATLFELGHLQNLPRHAQLTSQGAPTDRLCVLLDGRAKEHHLTRTGREVIVSLHGPGDIIWTGRSAGTSPPITSVTALEPLEVLIIEGSVAQQMLDRDPRLREAVQAALVRRLHDANVALVQHSTCDAHALIACRLLSLAQRWGRSSGELIEIDIALTQEELGSWAGLSREATVKALAELRHEGIVMTSRRHVTICDLDALQRTVEATAV